MKLGEAMYKAQNEEANVDDAMGNPSTGETPDGPESPVGSDDNVVDADFEEVDAEEKQDKSA